ncbi:hypothetical protein [Kribbella sp. NPDC000426]|uniref:hypothetical protein n=1 Tax=Kribbella sp. NPDC000426 TaxID=3154255 RepID=UPI00331CF190
MPIVGPGTADVRGPSGGWCPLLRFQRTSVGASDAVPTSALVTNRSTPAIVTSVAPTRS